MGICNSTQSTGEQKNIKSDNVVNPKNNNNEENKNKNNNNKDPSQLKINPPKKKDEEKKEEERKELKENEINKETRENLERSKDLNQRIEGQDIVISFGDSFKILDNFFNILSQEHDLESNNPKYNYDKFFIFDGEEKYIPRAIAVNIPREDYDNNMNQSRISNWYNQETLKIKIDTSNNHFKTINDKLFETMGNKELISDYNEFNNDNFQDYISDLFKIEAEKCDKVRTIHILGNIFNGISIGSLSSFLYSIQNDYRDSLKISHLSYLDKFQHRAFTKIKNYIFGISDLYDHCNMINFFNSPRPADVLSNLTIGERIERYVKDINLNKIMNTILINSKANFVYSNGCVFKKKDDIDYNINFLFEDCKEGKSHSHYYSQLSCFCIYKGNLLFNEEEKNKIFKKMAELVDFRLKKNTSYYDFYNIDYPFQYDFVSNIHQSEYFNNLTEEYLLAFLQNYNIDNFTQEEKERRDDTIYKVNNILNEYKEIWRLIK